MREEKKYVCVGWGEVGGQITMQKGPLSIRAVCELHGVCDCFSFFKLASSFSSCSGSVAFCFSVSHSDLVVVIIDIAMMTLDVSSKPISPAGNPGIVYSCNDFPTGLGAHLLANKYPSRMGD